MRVHSSINRAANSPCPSPGRERTVMQTYSVIVPSHSAFRSLTLRVEHLHTKTRLGESSYGEHAAFAPVRQCAGFDSQNSQFLSNRRECLDRASEMVRLMGRR